MLNFNSILNCDAIIELSKHYNISLKKLANLTDDNLKTLSEKHTLNFTKLKRKRKLARRRIKKINEIEEDKYKKQIDSIIAKIKDFTYQEYIKYIKDLDQYNKNLTINVWNTLNKEKMFDNRKLESSIVDVLKKLKRPSTIKEIELKINEEKLFQFTTLDTFVIIGETLQKYIFDEDEISSNFRFYKYGAYYDIKPINSEYVKNKNENEIKIALKIDKNPRFFNDALRSEIYLRDKGICQICGVFVTISNYDCDHLIPFSKGGNTILENGQCTCKRCNRSKGNNIED